MTNAPFLGAGMSRCLLPIVLAAGLHMGSAVAQPMQILIESEVDSILTLSRAALQGGTHPAVSYYPAGVGKSTQVVRGNQYVQCFSNVPADQLSGKRVSFDQNRPFEPRLANPQDMADLQRTAPGMIQSGSEPFLLHAGELLGFDNTVYSWLQMDLNPPGRVLAVEDVDGVCYPMAAPELTNSVEPPACDLFGNDMVANDIVFRSEFEREVPGTLKISVDVTPGFLNTTTSYVYTIWAENGPVHDVQLREQFPFFEDNEVQPVYQRSMRLAHPWVCSAFGEAHCGDGGREQAGLGYLVTNNGRLAKPAVANGNQTSDGSCLRIEVQGRAVRNDGYHDNMAFSNSLHVAARYTSWAWDQFDNSIIHLMPNRFTYQRQLFTTPPEPN